MDLPIWRLPISRLIPDTDGDGVDDLIVGTSFQPASGTDEGSYFVFSGAKLVNSAEPLAPDDALGTFSTELDGLELGPTADIDGDGTIDITFIGGGKIRVFFGPHNGHRSIDVPDSTIEGRKSAIGDTDGDGVPELIVGDLGHRDAAGSFVGAIRVYRQPLDVYNSATSATVRIVGEIPDGELGQSVAVPGDVNGDGNDDVIAVAPFGLGRKGIAYLFLGPLSPGTDLSDAATVFNGVNTHLTRIGDVNGDGRSDILIKSLRINLFFEVPPGVVGESAADATVSDFFDPVGPCDIDGNGVDDIVSWRADEVRVLLAPLPAASTLLNWDLRLERAKAPNPAFVNASRGSCSGDVDADGRDDLVFVQSNSKDGVSRVFVQPGASFAPIVP